MSKHDFNIRLNGINKEVQSVIKDFENEYGLNSNNPEVTNYQVHLTSGKIFRGFYIGTKIYASHWDNSVDILVSFWRTKKDGKRSKVHSGFFLKEIISIDNLPF